MEIHNHGKFHHIAYVVAKLKIYKQSFAYRFTIHEIALSGRFFGPYFPKLPKFSPGVVL